MLPARRAAVLIATVSRVVHGQDRVREATRIRVQQAIEELGYVPDGAAQSLSRRRKDIIGMMCVERETAGQHDVETECLLLLRRVRARRTGADPRQPVAASQQLHKGKTGPAKPANFSAPEPPVGQGRRTSPSAKGSPTPGPSSASPHGPSVVIIAGTPGAQAADVVAADTFSGAAALITHLIADHGRQRLFHVGGPPNSPDAIQRRLALDHALRNYPQCQLIGSAQGIFSVASGEQAGKVLLARHRAARPDAVACANDQMAIGVLRTLTAASVCVPDEIAVTGFDDLYPACLADSPPLTTVHQPMRTLGERACARLPRPHRPPGPQPRRATAPTELVLRSSCGCPPGPATRQAVKTIRPAHAN